MEDQEKAVNTDEISRLSNELTYRRYLMNQGKLHHYFRRLSVPEYIALHSISVSGEADGGPGSRTYLQDLAEKLKLTIRQTSKMIGELRDRGLLVWSHDGNGSEGTYVVITENGRKLLAEQEAVLKEYYGRVFERFGKENVICLLEKMKELDTIMAEEFEKMEGENDSANE